MKKIFKAILGCCMGAVVGFGGVMLIIWLIELGVEPISSPEKAEKGIEWGTLILSICLSMVFAILGGILHTIMHEAGHLIGGLLTGYKFVSFRVFKFLLMKDEGKLIWKKYDISGTLGQCIMEPPRNIEKEDIPYVWYNISGILMNLLIFVLSIVMLRLFNFGIVWLSWWVLLACVGLFMALMNGIPYSFNGLSNDGRNLWLLYRYPENRKYFATTLWGTAELSCGKRIVDMPQEWFSDIPLTNPKDYFVMTYRIIYMTLQEDMGNYDYAREITEEMMAFGKDLPQLFAMEIGGERVMLELMTLNRKEVINHLWTNQLQKYVKLNSKYSPGKLSILFAYEMLFNNDTAKAEKYYQELIKKKDSFSMPGEAKTAINICNHIYHIKNSRTEITNNNNL